jgi:hypothetical protein
MIFGIEGLISVGIGIPSLPKSGRTPLRPTFRRGDQMAMAANHAFRIQPSRQMKCLDQARENVLSSATASCKRWRRAERARLHLYRPNKDAAISYKHDSGLQFYCGFRSR